MTVEQKRWLSGVSLSLVASLAMIGSGMAGSFSLPVGLAGTAAALAAGWRRVPRFGRLVWASACGGVVAGVLVLGPGFRSAMRLVAILEPTRRPEFTVEGTMFIIVGVGLVMGGAAGLIVGLLRVGAGMARPVAAGMLTLALTGLLLAGGELRSELLELGWGGWFNIPLFGSVTFLYGIIAFAIADRVLEREAASPAHEAHEVPA